MSLASLRKLIKYHVLTKLNRLRYAGTNRHCNVCGRDSKQFLRFGEEQRPDACCPMCFSVERDRLTLIFLQKKTEFFHGSVKRFLHVAPERALKKRFRDAVGEGYLSGDLSGIGAMEKMDILDIKYPDCTFDAIYCSHVLEHVPDDQQAMREFYRTLKPGGWAILNVPITHDETFEDPSVTSPEERLRVFGQADHMRRYGPDYKDRLVNAGFHVEVVSPNDLSSHEEQVKLGMTNRKTGDVYFCTKP
ncbi:class I SAM-dependent methyltransferase [Novipirellula sp. SH528]|uniref:class I SAM-dependent methyltransferase n=1 Tax=Novipirellula sp. SH528 TaxID=3454466 RepID=UPI003FA09C29